MPLKNAHFYGDIEAICVRYLILEMARCSQSALRKKDIHESGITLQHVATYY